MDKEKYIEIVQYLKSVIADTEFENNLYTVGGCERDALLGDSIKDIDLVVSLPNGGIKFAEWLSSVGLVDGHMVVYPTYGTAMLRLKKFPELELEFVQTRREQYKDKESRNPETEFGTITEDCFRRDLTINSIYRNVSTGEVLDLTGKAFKDIENQIIRTTNDNPNLVFSDDPLRILRVCRFASRYEWTIEAATYESMVLLSDRLSIISKERINEEFCKMITCKSPYYALVLIKGCGALRFISKYASKLKPSEYSTICMSVNKANGLEQSLAAFYILSDAETAKKEMRDLKFSNDVISKVCFLIENSRYLSEYDENFNGELNPFIRKFQYFSGDKIEDLLDVIDIYNCYVRNIGPNQVRLMRESISAMKKNGFGMSSYKLPIDGNDVMKAKGISPSSKVKEYLDYCLKMAFVYPKYTKEEFIKMIKKVDL